MIKKRKFYIIECDDCGEWCDLSGEGGYTVFKTKKAAREAIKDQEGEYDSWVVNGGHFCDCCNPNPQEQEDDECIKHLSVVCDE